MTADARPAQIATICECIDHCFAFKLWCDDFAAHVDPDDLQMGQDRAYDVVSDATRLLSFLSLRKLDDFLRAKSRTDDLVAETLSIKVSDVLGGDDKTFLSSDNRNTINKSVAHLTEQLTLAQDSEVDLAKIITESLPAISSLVAGLRKINTEKDVERVIAKTETLIKRVEESEKSRPRP